MSEGARAFFRRAICSLSFANLLALHVWLVLFRPAQETPLPAAAFEGATVAVLVLAVALLLTRYLVDSLPSWMQAAGLRLAGLVCLWALVAWAAAKPSVQQLIQQGAIRASPRTLAALSVLVILPLLAVLLKRRESAGRAMTMLALVLSPYAAVNLAHASWEFAQRDGRLPEAGQVDAPYLAAGEQRRRTVVLLFDEFDYELAFDLRVRREALSAFAELRTQSLFATQAYPPMHSTAMSIPAMLTGRLVEQGVGSNAHPGDLELQYHGGEKALWSTQETLFTDLRATGWTSLRLNDALLPHSPLMGPAEADIVIAPASGVLSTVWQFAASNISTVATLLPFATSNALDVRLNRWFGLPSYSRHVQGVADQIVDLAGDARADLLFLHILLPHLPVVVDARSGQFADVVSSDYRDNLAGVDRVVSRVLARLRERNRLDTTNLLIVSDHFLRVKNTRYGLGDHRVPFVARFAQDRAAVGDFSHPFNTLLFREIVRAIVAGDVSESRELARWLEAHAKFGESPLTEYRNGW